MDNSQKIQELKSRVAGIEPLEDESDFFTSDETIERYLKARDWNLHESEKMLKESIEYRRKVKPQRVDCKWCKEQPGSHSMRQVGFDKFARPVIYSSFVQASMRSNTVDDSVAHCTYLIENAKRSMKSGVSTWVWILDCTGMSIQACNPRLGYGVSQVMSNHYPERLGLTIIINHNPIFHGIWKAMKVFIHPNTAAKVNLIKGKHNIHEAFDEIFSYEMSTWLLEEIRLNKEHPLPDAQREFWKSPPEGASHDPRGCASYVKEFKNNIGSENSSENKFHIHKPHPNILKSILEDGQVFKYALDQSQHQSSTSCYSMNSENSENLEQTDEIDIPDEYKVPADAVKFDS